MYLTARKGCKVVGLTNEGVVKKVTKDHGGKVALVRWAGAKRDMMVPLDGNIWSSEKHRMISFLMAEREANIHNWGLAAALAEVQRKNDTLPL